MSGLPDITLTANFHREGALALPTLDSMRDMVDAARARGLNVEARAVLDRADDLTRHLIATRGAWLCGVEEVSVGDLGLARNAGSRSARGQFLAFLDGDDLFGAEWLHLAYSAAKDANEAIWRPECLYHFCDFELQSPSYAPTISVMISSDAPEFDPDVIFFGALWGNANAFAPRTVYLRHPFVDKRCWVEDWSWSIETLFAGIPHRIVPDTVQFRRTKELGSLHQQNIRDGLLPRLPSDAWPRLGEERIKLSLKSFGTVGQIA